MDCHFLFFLTLALSLSLGCSPPPITIMTVSGITPEVHRMQVLALVNRVGTLEQDSLDVSAAPDQPSLTFGLRIPFREPGQLVVGVGAFDQQGCLIATGASASAGLGRDDQVTLALTPLVRSADRPCKPAAPVLVQVTPTEASTLGHERLTLRGFGFRPDAQIKIAGRPAEAVVWHSPLEMSAAVPEAPSVFGTVPVEVIQPPDAAELRKDLLTLKLSTVAFGSATLASTTALPCYPGSIAAGDFNLDGYPELVSVGPECKMNASQVFLYENLIPKLSEPLQENYFAPQPVGLPLSVKLQQVLISNMNSDLYEDIAILSGSGGSPTEMAMLLSLNSLDNFFVRKYYTIPLDQYQPTGMVIGRFSGNSHPDVVVAGADIDNSRTGRLMAVRNSGSDLIPLSSTPDRLAYRPGRMAVLPANNSAAADLLVVTAYQASSRIYEYKMNAFTERYSVVDVDAAHVAVGDIDLDGLMDLVFVNPGLSRISVWLNKSTASALQFTAAGNYPAENYPTIVKLADLDRDGDLDMVVVNQDPVSSVSILLNKGNGTFIPTSSPSFPTVLAADKPVDMTLADLDQDGLLDIALATQGASRLQFLMNRSR